MYYKNLFLQAISKALFQGQLVHLSMNLGIGKDVKTIASHASAQFCHPHAGRIDVMLLHDRNKIYCAAAEALSHTLKDLFAFIVFHLRHSHKLQQEELMNEDEHLRTHLIVFSGVGVEFIRQGLQMSRVGVGPIEMVVLAFLVRLPVDIFPILSDDFQIFELMAHILLEL